MPWPAVVAAGLTVGGALGSQEIQRNLSLKNWNRQNAYNTPSAQIARLREAGLPLATMFGGQGGSTSSPIDRPQVDPTLGVAQGIQAYNQTMMQRKQLQVMDQDLRTKTAEADIKEAERDFLLHRQIDGTIDIKDFEPQYGDTNLVQGQRRERAIKEAELATKNILKEIEQLNLDNAPDKIRAQIDNIISSTGLANLQITRDANYNKMLDQVMKDLIQGGTGLEGVGRLLQTWFYKTVLR